MNRHGGRQMSLDFSLPQENLATKRVITNFNVKDFEKAFVKVFSFIII